MAGNAGIAGGSDSYGYVSQADLWLKRDLHIAQPDARRVPWPLGQWTLSPLGYRPSTDGNSIVPVYAPGLPMMMAGAKALAGQCAVGWVVPITGALLVAATFGIGRRMHSDAIGAAAAWLVATSPTFLAMQLQPMSDVPVAAFWAVAIYGCLLGSTVGAILAGIAAAVAILIRPNLVHLAVLMSLWLIVRDLKQRRRGSALLNLIAFAIPVGIAGLAIGYLNRELYGEATTSGYGPLGYIYSQYRAPTNVVRYSYWLIQSNTPIAFAGLLALFVPLSLGAFGRLKIPGRGLLTTICAGAIGTYLVYIIFDAWWYLRFLLPAWPAIFVSTAWLLSWPSGRSYGRAALVLLFGVGVYGLWFAQHRAGVFSFGEDDRRYATVGHLVRDATPPNSIIFSMQHSGSVRYYSGRMSLRYDFLNQRWLDRAVDWLNREGMHPYFLLDEWEVKEFERRFEAVNALAHLHVARVWEYRGAPRVFLYDPLQPERTGEKSVIFYTSEQRLPSCPVPEPPPHFVVR